MTSEEYIQNHSAFWQQNGFDFQFALFVKYLFECGFNDVVKYEVEDDIVIEHSAERIDLIQVKHSYEKNKKMTNSNSDVWKTIINWLDFLKSREAEDKPTREIKCILVVNMMPEHDFLTVIDKVNHGEADYTDVVKCLKELRKLKTCESEVKRLLQEKKKIMQLISKIEVRQVDDPIQDVFDQFNQKYHMPMLADDVLSSILGKLWKKKEEHKSGIFQYRVKDFLYDFSDELQSNMIKAFEPIEDEEERDFPDDYLQWMMVKQLASVGISDPFSLSYYFGSYWCYKNSINTYCVKTHKMAEEVRRKIEARVIQTWQGCFLDANHKFLGDNAENADEKELKESGFSCLSMSLKSDVAYKGIQIKPNFSSGWMLELSNEQVPRIVWRADWLKK